MELITGNDNRHVSIFLSPLSVAYVWKRKRSRIEPMQNDCREVSSD